MPLTTLSRRAWASPYLLLALTTLLWGGNAIASRIAIDNVSPMALTSLRWVGVALIFPVMFRKELVAHWPTIRANAPKLVWMGFIGFTLFNALMYLAGHSTTAINMGIIQGAIPVMVMAGAFALHGARLTPLQIVGVLVTMLGVALTAARGDLAALSTLAVAQGDILMITACAFYAGYTLALRRRPQLPALVFFTCLAIVACIGSLALLGWEIAAGQVLWPNAKGWLLVLYVTVGPSIASQLMFMRGVELIGPSRAGLFVNLVPIWAAILAVVLIAEPFAAYHAVALALVLGGIWLAERNRA
ncbi:MAG: DMT family transporter [Bosea sp.]|jgi:drug/metabolite transporter (DMT)-like permease|nr:DMT family transporter [Bosea sp. (in: a-proteobacteria)]